MKYKPLDDLEMFEILQAAYPEKFEEENDDTWFAAQDFWETIESFEDLADLLGRIAMLTMPMESGMTKRWSHCLGKIEIKGGKASMIAAIRRDMEIK